MVVSGKREFVAICWGMEGMTTNVFSTILCLKAGMINVIYKIVMNYG
jgi:hypothetical protein